MKYMFEGYKFWPHSDENTHNLSSWNVSKVIDMTGMFKDANLRNLEIKNLKLNNWDIRNVMFMNYMFHNVDYYEEIYQIELKILFEPKNFGPSSIKKPIWGPKHLDKSNIRQLLKEWLTNKDLFELKARDINTKKKINKISEWDVSSESNFDNLFDLEKINFNKDKDEVVDYFNYLKIVDNYDDIEKDDIGNYRVRILDSKINIEILEITELNIKYSIYNKSSNYNNIYIIKGTDKYPYYFLKSNKIDEIYWKLFEINMKINQLKNDYNELYKIISNQIKEI